MILSTTKSPLQSFAVHFALTLSLACSGCASPSSSNNQTVLNDLQQWITQPSQPPPPQTDYVRAEQAFFNLDTPAALRYYLDVLKDPKQQALHTPAAHQIAAIVSSVPSQLQHDTLTQIQALHWSTIDPYAWNSLAYTAASIASDIHQHNQVPKPFPSQHFGLIHNWTSSPLLSKRVSQDFHHTFTWETQPLTATLEAPILADDRAKTATRVITHYQTTTPNRGLGGPHGVYLFESYLLIPPNAPNDYVIYASSGVPSIVSLNGTTLFSFDTHNSHHPYRYAEIQLSAGLHRIVVKEAFDSRRGNSSSSMNTSIRLLPKNDHPLQTLSNTPIEILTNCFGKPLPGWCQEIPANHPFPPVQILRAETSLNAWDTATTGLQPLPNHSQLPSATQNDQHNQQLVSDMSPGALYLALRTALASKDDELFETLWPHFHKTYTSFAPANYLHYRYLKQAHNLPSDYAASHSLLTLREGIKHDPTNRRLLLSLYSSLRGGALDEDVEILKALIATFPEDEKSIGKAIAYTLWGIEQDNEGRNQDAEEAFQTALQSDPESCSAASKLLNLYYLRDHMVSPKTLLHNWESCNDLRNTYLLTRSATEQLDASLKRARLQFAQTPFSTRSILNLVDALHAHGDHQEMTQLLLDAIQRWPHIQAFGLKKIDLELAGVSFSPSKPNGEQPIKQPVVHPSDASDSSAPNFNAAEAKTRALATYDHLLDIGTNSRLLYRRSQLTGTFDIPGFTKLLPNGVDEAIAEAKAHPIASLSDASTPNNEATIGDEAYYLIDKSVDAYQKDAVRVVLIYGLIRVMTKDAINRYAEQTLPQQAIPIRIRTIKQDGTTQTPDNSSKGTYSMTGLAEGDFIEVAYILYDSPSADLTPLASNAFFFQMKGIGTRRSEYIILGLDQIPSADIRPYRIFAFNNAPKPEPITIDGVKGLRFVSTNNPRPRSEPATDHDYTYLPWIQFSHDQGFEADAKRLKNRTQDAYQPLTQVTPFLALLFDSWKLKADSHAPFASKAWIEQLYLLTTETITSPQGTGNAATEIARSKTGSPYTLFITALKYFNIPFDIFAVRSSFFPTTDYRPLDIQFYIHELLRIQSSDGDVWTTVGDRFSSFNVANSAIFDQPAICITCKETLLARSPNASAFHPNRLTINLNGSLDDTGALRGTLELVISGTSAAAFRQMAANLTNKDLVNRAADQLINSLIPASQVERAEFQQQEKRDLPLRVSIAFLTPHFGRITPTGLEIDTPFLGNDATSLVRLPTRTTPMLAGSNSEETIGHVTIDLPSPFSPTLVSPPSFDLSQLGNSFSRDTSITHNRLSIEFRLSTKLLHVSTTDYPLYRDFITELKRSSHLHVRFPKQPL